MSAMRLFDFDFRRVHVGGPGFGYVGLVGVAFVEVDTVAESQRSVCRQGVIAFVRVLLVVFEIVDSEWVGGEETVVPDMPVGGVSQVLRVVHDRYADSC